MTYNQAIEILKNAQNYSMIEIREAEQVIDEMVDKAQAFSELQADNDLKAAYIEDLYEQQERLKRVIDEKNKKAEAFDELYAEFDKGDKDLSIADFNEVIERYKFGDSHA